MQIFERLKDIIEGDVFTDEIHRIIYSTDASAYKEKPVAIVRPKNNSDIKKIIAFANESKISLIPRAAGTSLAGQVVGNGIIVDISKYFTQIIELNNDERWIKVQPGVVLDELNKFLEPYGLFFGPETSTSNRCMIGGMLGNNACGSHSILYGSTRDHTLEAVCILSDGSEVVFKAVTKNEFDEKCTGDTLENRIYQNIKQILSDKKNQESIRKEYPDKSIKRRNTGYAIDLLLETEPFTNNNIPFNFCKLLAGSEGTLAFVTEIKLNLVALPPKEKAVIAVHLNSLKDAALANLIALKYKPGAVELMDKTILDLTKGNLEQQKNRFFLKDEPSAILIIEFARETKDEIIEIAANIENDIRKAGYGYHFPVIWGNEINKVWNLRKSGLGVLSNMEGDAKPVSVIEDTAINVEKLPDFIIEFDKMIALYNLTCVYHAHIGSGELHLRPVLNLKSETDTQLFRTVALETAKLVKSFNGSLSGEHGDGRLRGEFIPIIIGEENYNLLKEIKQVWDANHIFNPGKIVDTPQMNTSLRYNPPQETREINTYFDFSQTMGILRAAEKCNGSADCRKSSVIGGTMCPSYMVTKDEKNSTRARANILREFLSNSDKTNPFDHDEIYEIMDLCLSCKGCKAECPSNVDIAKLKAEFLQHYYDANGISLRSWLVGNIAKINRMGAIFPAITNFFLKRNFIKKTIGFSTKRNLPELYKTTFEKWFFKNQASINENVTQKTVFLFIDEFTNYNDVEIGMKAVRLLGKLGYNVQTMKHFESGRTYLSKGMLKMAKYIAARNVEIFKHVISKESPLIGVEPSAILSFRDEYPDLLKSDDAKNIAKNTFLIDEFLAIEMNSGNISKEMFTTETKLIKLHGHCQQKSIASTEPTKMLLTFPENYSVEEIPSGCCGMAGSFGYEKEHYEFSNQVGELVLFPAVRNASKETLIAAPGTSCRHHIFDATGRIAKHPVEILFDALKTNQL